MMACCLHTIQSQMNAHQRIKIRSTNDWCIRVVKVIKVASPWIHSVCTNPPHTSSWSKRVRCESCDLVEHKPLASPCGHLSSMWSIATWLKPVAHFIHSCVNVDAVTCVEAGILT